MYLEYTAPAFATTPPRGEFRVSGAAAAGRGPARSEAKGQGSAPPLGTQGKDAHFSTKPQVTGFLGRSRLRREAAATAVALRADRARDFSSEVLRRERYAAQTWLWKHSGARSVRGCGRVPVSAEAGVALTRHETGAGVSASFGGLATCGSVWACAVCATAVQAERADELRRAGAAWMKSGGGLSMLTLTMRHQRKDSLEACWDGVLAAWAAITRGGAWTGNRTQAGDKAEFGIAGTVRAVEVTHGAHGWHVHLHVLIPTDAPLTQERAEKLRTRIFGRWSKSLVKSGFEAPSDERGARLDVVRGLNSVEKMCAYLAKQKFSGIAAEIATGGLKKSASGRTPFQILAEIVKAEAAPNPSDLRLWEEWEKISSGKRQLSWSRGLRAEMLALAEPEPEELEEAEPEPEELGRFSAYAWRKICRIAPARALILEAVEAGTTAEQSREKVLALCAGLRIPPLIPPSLPNPAPDPDSAGQLCLAAAL